MSGCSLLGYYKPKQAERAPPVESAKVAFPDSFEQGTHLDGPAMAALEVAMNAFLPPDRRPEARDEALARCLARRDTYDTTVMKENDDLYFVSFLPRLSRCGIDLETPIMDAGAVYAIDARGRILAEL
ncbi:hypothetical protein LXT21_42450 [Myxococcus sp. K38C18041901]|uniref:hypothetical protein n=1 Tax=Myxococcus guangdongensis TaxID=2906760 RepID=UPI0020A79D9C|nr:hypothetical protein [Myxococcus guangdongensis]MCP3065445.1 hypothetical protein [Myxococcus guangdongensis]